MNLGHGLWRGQHPRPRFTEVFWFFFAKKNRFLHPVSTPPVIARATPVVVGSESGNPRSERTAR